MKVGFVSHTSRLGGAERSLLETLRALGERGVSCTVLLPSRGPLGEAVERLGMSTHTIPYKWWSATEGGRRWKRVARTAWNLALVPRIVAWIRRERIDIVYTNTVVTGVGALAAALARRPHVWHLRELGYVHNRMVFDLGERLSLGVVRRLSALCLANSNCVADRYRQALQPTPVHVIYQNVTLDGDTGARSESFFRGDGLRCALVGSIGPGKRQEEALHAVARLREQGRRAELLVVGTGDLRYERYLRGLVAQLGIGGSVSFLGQLESAAPVIRAADVVLNCSRHEAFGRVTVEGMLAGKPVVGARSAGTAELIQEGRTGLLYEPGDVERLAGTLAHLIEDPVAARRIGDAARRWASGRFTDERFGTELLERLRPLIG